MFHVIEKYRLINHPQLGSDSSYGNAGFFIIPHHRILDYFYNIQASDGEGWEHVSITLTKKDHKKIRSVERCCTWEEMCFIKNLFWDETDCVIEFHPPKSEYVSMHPYCLHLWRPTNQIIPMPDSIMVGIKQLQ